MQKRIGKQLIRLAAASFFMLGMALQAGAPVPRPAGEFKIHEPSGRETLLSSQKGKVVVIQFLFTWCGHCQATAQQLSQMQAELGPKGLVVYGVAFNDEVQTKDAAANNKMVTEFGKYASFPVGLASRESVLKFLGISVMDKLGVPQLVAIDRKGMIQAQTKPSPGQGEIIEPQVMRATVTKLLAEK
jgi:thiol-disulfide isomerase/thioredoxin